MVLFDVNVHNKGLLLPRRFLDIGPVALTVRQLANFAICILLLILVSLYVRRTSWGRATRAIAERPDVAAAFGVNVGRICQFTILMASSMAVIGWKVPGIRQYRIER